MRLHFAVVPDGIVFSATGPSGAVPVREWLDTEEWTGGRADVLYRLLDDSFAEIVDTERIIVRHEVVATLSKHEIASLGLPMVADFSLRLRAIGTLTSADAQLEAVLIRSGGIPVLSPGRMGSVLEAGGKRYVVLDPLYSVLERVDAFNGKEVSDPLAAWGRLREVLPEDANVDDYLNGVKVSFASSFKLKPFLNGAGEPDFDVLPGRREDSALPDAPPVFEEALPPSRSEEFAGYFRRLGRPRAQYPAGTGWYIVFSEAMAEAVVAIKALQTAPMSERREFLLRPHAVLKDRLPDLSTDQIEALFFDIGYSDRVVGIGVWENKVLPWVKKPSDPWLPPEQLGVRVGDEFVRIEPEDLEHLRQEVEDAIKEGRPLVEYKGQLIPAAAQTLTALDQLVGERKPTGGDGPPKAVEPPDRGRVVLQIHGNLEEVDFRAFRRPRGLGIRQATPWVLRTTLFSHQTEAVEWLQNHWETGSPGALLADDMGLGKTLEALAFLAWTRELMENEAYPSLPCVIVAPTGLLENWKEEVARHL